MILVSLSFILDVNDKLAPNSARQAYSSPQEILSSIENQQSKFYISVKEKFNIFLIITSISNYLNSWDCKFRNSLSNMEKKINKSLQWW